MMKQWEEEGQQDQFNDVFMDEWGKQWQQQEPEKVEVIPFEPKN